MTGAASSCSGNKAKSHHRPPPGHEKYSRAERRIRKAKRDTRSELSVSRGEWCVAGPLFLEESLASQPGRSRRALPATAPYATTEGCNPALIKPAAKKFGLAHRGLPTKPSETFLARVYAPHPCTYICLRTLALEAFACPHHPPIFPPDRVGANATLPRPTC
jgi:hypothetical protein